MLSAHALALAGLKSRDGAWLAACPPLASRCPTRRQPKCRSPHRRAIR